MIISPYITEFYNKYNEDDRLTQNHGMVEFSTTMRYIQRYLSPGKRVLEVGAGTGRYSHALALQGYAVDAVELVEHNIEMFRRNTQENERITVMQGNALDLSALPDDQYDITLLLGPLYHLYTIDDKRQAIGEAIRVTKSGGIIFASYVISDGCLIDEGFYRKNINITEYIGRGLLDAKTFSAKSDPKDLFELVRKEDVDELMSVFSACRLHYVATDGLSLMLRETIDSMDDKMFELFLKYHYVTCERSDFVGVTSHALDIFKNNKSSL